jgi:hypothetical protein
MSALNSTSYRADEVVNFDVYANDGTLAPITGLGDVTINIERASDGYFLDWDDLTFKDKDDVGFTTIDKGATEVDDVNKPGLYRVTQLLSAITNHTAARDRWNVSVTGGTGIVYKGMYEATIEPVAELFNRQLPTEAQITDGVWDEAIADHLTAGSTGEALASAGVGACATPEEIATYLRAQAALCTLPALDGLAPVYLKVGDRYPIFDRILSRDGQAINLATGGPSGGAAVGAALNYWPEGGTAAAVSRALTIAEAANGRVTYAWAVDEFTTEQVYDYEVVIDWGGGVEETVPKRGTSKINIDAEIS